MSTSCAIFFGFITSVVVVLLSVYIFNAYFVLAAACLLFVSVVIVFSRSKESNSGSLMLLIVTSFLFLWGRALIGILDSDFDVSIFELQEGIAVSNIGLNTYLQVVFASIVTFSFTLLFLFKSRNFDANQKCIFQCGKDFSYLAPWKLLFNVGILFSLLQATFFLRHFMSGGTYYEIFTLGKDTITFPGLSFLASFLFIGYVGIFVFSNDRKLVLVNMLLFLFLYRFCS